jgi:hypothetical protein
MWCQTALDSQCEFEQQSLISNFRPSYWSCVCYTPTSYVLFACDAAKILKKEAMGMMEDLRGSKGTETAQKDSPMRWALGPDGTAMHIFSIPPEKTGIKCECTCPGCQEPLQAVNARLNVPKGTPVWSASRTGRTMSQFFRHPSGHSRTSCLQKASQLATLTLFRTRGLIEVPAPISRQHFQGVSGKEYVSEMRGRPQNLLVRRSEWLDHQRASLILEDGRKVLVVLESSHLNTSDLDFDGVISVRCDDPEIAGLAVEEILARVVLSDQHTCWVRHWEDGELNAKALEQAKADAIDALDWLSDEAAIDLGDIKLTNESLLHLVIKHIIAQAGYIITPDFVQHIPYEHDFMHDEVVRLPGARHTLQSVRLEHALPGMVPDVYCDIVENGTTYPLAIEVFVTHSISPQKLNTIKAKNLRCLEVDVARFKEHGQLSIEKLRELVLSDPNSKVWKHHPDIESALNAAHARIKERDARIAVERAKHQERERQIRAQETLRLQKIDIAKKHYKIKITRAPIESLPEIFKDAVLYYLAEVKRGMADECYVVPSELAAEMRRAGYSNGGDRFFWNVDGTMMLLMSLAWGAKLPPTTRDKLVDQVFSLYNQEPSFIPLVLRAIKRFGVQLTTTQEQKLAAVRRHAWESIRKGEFKFARNRQYDSLMGVILPVLLPDLAEPEGTLEDAHRRQSMLKQELDRERAQKQAQALEHARSEVDLIEWASPPLSVDNAYRIFTSWEVEHYCAHSIGFSPVHSKEVINMAYEESKLGGPIRDWVEWAGVNSATDVHNLVELLRKLKLIRHAKPFF